MRNEPDVPITLADVNPESLNLIFNQGYPETGFVVANSNCAVAGLATALAPLTQFGIRQVTVATYQALSGAGYLGHSALEMNGNIIPFIPNEEMKIERELPLFLGQDVLVSATSVRVNVPFGHTEAVWVDLEREVALEEIVSCWEGSTVAANLPTLPEHPIRYSDRETFPQPSMSFEGSPAGMQVLIGRARITGNRLRFVLLVNNLVRGAAGGSVANAELFVKNHGSKLCQGL